MMNFGDFKKYLKNGKRREDMIGVPRVAEDEDKKEMAKTFLKVTLAQHDKVYHKGGYHEGDKCNFREALKRGDSADELAEAEKKEGEVKVGFVKFKENEETGKKEIVGIEEAKKVEVKGDEGKKVEVAGLKDGGMDGQVKVKGEGEQRNGSSSVAEDWKPVKLEEHDKRFHPNGYKDGDSCKFREALMRGDSADQIEAAEGEEAAEKQLDESDVAAYLVLSEPIYSGKWKDGRTVKDEDLPRIREKLDGFMLEHPEIAGLNEDAAYDLENAVGRTPGWHRNDKKAGRAEVWSDDDVDFVVEELMDTPDKETRDLFEAFFPEGHFGDAQEEGEMDEAYQQALQLAVNWAFHDDPEVWAKARQAATTWAYKAQSGHVVDIGAMAKAVKRLIGAAAEAVARKSDPVERYLAVAAR